MKYHPDSRLLHDMAQLWLNPDGSLNVAVNADVLDSDGQVHARDGYVLRYGTGHPLWQAFMDFLEPAILAHHAHHGLTPHPDHLPVQLHLRRADRGTAPPPLLPEPDGPLPVPPLYVIPPQPPQEPPAEPPAPPPDLPALEVVPPRPRRRAIRSLFGGE